MMATRTRVAAILVAATATLHAQQSLPEPSPQERERFRFKSGVELINVTATVSDENGRFVPGLRLEDFVVYEDEKIQTVTHFSSDRIPVSLGIVLDTSGSMEGEKIRAARSSLERLLSGLDDPQDEFFL